MPQKRTILVTGVAGFFGARVAGQLLALPDVHVIGLDVRPPRERLRGLDFIQADLRNPLLPDLVRDEGIDTLCHLAFVESDRPNESAFDANVMGTIRLVGACNEAGVRKAVLMSSTWVYGARPDNSAFLAEDRPLHGSARSGTVRDLVEIECFCDGFRRQAPDLQMTILRFPGVVGPTVDSALTRFLREMWAPLLLGFDPMMQVIHEDDAAAALVHAVAHDVPGIFNVAAEPVLPLSQLAALAGKPPVPVVHLAAYWGTGLLRRAGVSVGRYLPIDPDYLRYPCVGDLARMRDGFGFAPRYTSTETLREFAGHQRLARYLPERAMLAYDEERLRDTIERRRRARARRAEQGQPEALIDDDPAYPEEDGGGVDGHEIPLEDGPTSLPAFEVDADGQ